MSEWGYLRYRKDMGPFEQVGDENPNIDLLVSTSWMELVFVDHEAAIERARTYLSHHASYEEQIHQAVDAALGGT